MKRKVKKKKLKIKNVLFAIFFLFILIISFNYISKIKVKGCYVKGNTFYSDEEILKITGINNSSSFLFTNSVLINTKIRKNNIIKKIKIKKDIFLNFTIIVDERKILFNDLNEKKLVLEGGIKINENYLDAPTLIDKIDDKKIYDKFTKKMLKIDKDTLNSMSEIKYEPNYIDKERFLVSMNDGNYIYLTLSKFHMINNYSKISKTLGDKNGILYLDYGNYFLSL